MRILLIAMAAALPASSAAAPPERPAPAPRPIESMPVIDPTPDPLAKCPPISRYHAMKRGRSLAPRKLAEFPPADHYKSAYRTINGCEVPIIARFRPGGR